MALNHQNPNMLRICKPHLYVDTWKQYYEKSQQNQNEMFIWVILHLKKGVSITWSLNMEINPAFDTWNKKVSASFSKKPQITKNQEK